ncbi:phage tail protein [Desulfovibrio subterraneus]|uniref:Phage tail protein n=1 Tax=Desulfovibrio subterraneus TaxID=2718620 RepID=A0A7J0BLC3_9BACT|nr:phage tail protein [Desulfovibrio subterraneus]GFM34022.1 hypothetical protein DSM101010T_23870 [Desulfovibrio subterraneus]
MAGVMIKLGAYVFSLDTAAYQQLSRATAYRWQALERVNQLAALQFTGPGEDSISLNGVILPTFRGGLGQLDVMRAEAAKGEPLLMVDGRGYVHGRWVILSVNETQKTFERGGAPLQIEFSIRLRKYDEGY